MTGAKLTSRKLEFHRAPPEPADYATLYRVGAPSGPAPLVVYVGGALSDQEREARRYGEPVAVQNEIEAAIRQVPVPRVDVLVCPAPVTSREPGHGAREQFIDHLQDELIPALEAPAPSALAFVGNSFGACIATYAALSIENARALVTFAGTGIADSAREAQPWLPKDLAIKFFWNLEDLAPRPDTYAPILAARYRAVIVPPRAGAHPFEDYAANGSVRDAFAFALEHLPMDLDCSRR